MRSQLTRTYQDIISIENILAAWEEFVRGKRHKQDVQEFSLQLMDNILTLHEELKQHTYRHGPYHAFKINDPKPRDIHKATVRDRLLHHAIYRILYPFFDKTFIADSYSCRVEKGTHKALNRFRAFSNKVSKNNTRTAWVLKCDIRKFFASIDHRVLHSLLETRISDADILLLLRAVVESFETRPGVGLPLGNLTSQLLVNVYMHEFDRHMKHILKTKYYIRYADDFVVFSEDRRWLEMLIPRIQAFLLEYLKLELHPQKLFLKTLASGVDFLGWVHFADNRVLRTATRKRMMRRLAEHPTSETIHSYLGLLKHGNTEKLQKKIREATILSRRSSE